MKLNELQDKLIKIEEKLKNLFEENRNGRQYNYKELENLFDEQEQTQRDIALVKGDECPTILNLPVLLNESLNENIIWRPEAAVSGPALYQTDHNCFLTFNAVIKGNDGYYHGSLNDNSEVGLKAVVEIKR